MTAMGGRPITDPKRRARICACYAETDSFRETGRVQGISDETVQKIVSEDRPDLMPEARGKKSRKKTKEKHDSSTDAMDEAVEKYGAALKRLADR